MQRYHQEIDFVRRRARLQMRKVTRWAETEEDFLSFTLGKYRKRAPLDCGKTRCGVCHPHKRWRGIYKTKAEQLRNQRYTDSLADYEAIGMHQP